MAACPRCREPKNENSPTCQVCGYKFTGVFKTCPAGVHVMDPSWTECAYCTPSKPGRLPTAAESAMKAGPGHVPTRLEGDDAAPVPAYAAAPAIAAAPAPVVPAPVVPATPRVGKKTEFGFAPGAAAGAVPQPVQQPVPQPGMGMGKIVGMLITYSWNPEGQVFPVRQGRNVIGRDEECEISFAQDATLSMKNTWIMFQGEFTIGDHLSKSGTDVDGKPIGQGEKPLSNYARIRTGSTHWIFVMAEPPAAGA